MKSYCITTLVVLLLSQLFATTLAANCYGPASKLAITEFDAFPSPVPVGGTLYIRANIQPTYDMGSAKVQFRVYYSKELDVSSLTPIVEINSLEFCNLSTSITCPLTAGTHILSWEYTVPNILPGTYQAQFTIVEDSPADGSEPYSCIQFPVTVAGTPSKSYSSWYQATLLGTALFTHQEDYTLRQIGEHLQVGLAGPLNGSISPTPYYGNIKYLSGSGDLVPNAYYDTSDFVWGLYGEMVQQTIGGKGQVSHIYEGDCYLGYINQYIATVGYFYDYSNPLLECTFHLNWTYTGSASAQISGYFDFNQNATIPFGWGYPLVYGRLGRSQVVTSDVGFLMVQGEVDYCTTSGALCASPPPSSGSSSGGLSSDKLGLAIGLPIGVLFLILIAAAAFFYYKKRRETEQEDGIFAVSRKPEYGSALVVDGIIEETMGNKTVQAMMEMRDEDQDGSGGESDSDRERERGGRSRSRSPRSRSITRSRSRSGQDSDPGDSADRDSDDE